MNARFGGSFAPPLSDSLIAKYDALIASLPVSPVKDALLALIKCAKRWWDLPVSEGTHKQKHPSGTGVVITLAQPIQDELWEHIPWQYELVSYGQLFEELPTGDLRNLAYHLLWFAKELNMDREPITTDLLSEAAA